MITIKPRTIVGRRCVIVFSDDVPLLTIWEEAFQQNAPMASQALLRKLMEYGIASDDTSELCNLIQTTVAMGADFKQLTAAVQTYLGEKLKEGDEMK